MRRKLAALFSTAALICTLTLTAGIALAANPSADLDQCANGQFPSSNADGCDGTAGTSWVNGNLGASKSFYSEGDSVPYRLRFGNLSLSSHVVTIEWDTTKSSKHALDYITTVNRSVTTANPCLGVSGCGAFTTFPIPKDPQVDNGSGSPITQAAGDFRLYGGTITAVSAYSTPNGTGFTGDKSSRLDITFTASVNNPVLAWGGHIATRIDWGVAASAVAISGSPYHTRLINLDGSGGNQDRSLSADAVVFPGSITIIKDAIPNDPQDFSFSTTGGLSPTTFSLDDDSNGTLSNTRLFSNITSFVTYTVIEGAASGWTLSFNNPVCTVTSPLGGSQGGNVGTRTITIGLKEGENVTCTFKNSGSPALSLTKVADPLTYNAVDQTISYTYEIENSGSTTLSGPFSITDDKATVTCTQPGDGQLSPDETMSCSATYTITQDDLDNGSVTNKATATNGTVTSNEATATVTAVVGPALSIVKEASPTTYSAVDQVITYTITATNDGNVTLDNVSVSDLDVTDLDCDPDEDGNQTSGFTLAPGDDLVCSATHKITQADIDAGSFANTACVDDGDAEDSADQACDDETVTADQNPALSIVKEASPTTYSAVDQVITYTITATNDGNVTLDNVSVSDLDVTDLDCDPDEDGNQTSGFTLAPGDDLVCSATHKITQADIDAGSFANTACVDDGDAEDSADQACDDETVTADQNPALSIVKEASPTTYSAVDQVITYTITATNDGNVTLDNVSVSDLDVTDLDCDPDEDGNQTSGFTLAPGDDLVCSATHKITQADIDAGSFANTACVDDGDAEDSADQACDDETVTADQNPALSIVKEASPTTYSAVDQVITYTITATNDGNVTLDNVSVSDLDVTDLDCDPDEDGNQTSGFTLAPGDDLVCSATHKITQADIDAGSFANTACVDDGDAEDSADQACDDETVTADQNPSLLVEKDDDGERYDVGDVIDYTITVKNNGNVTLTDISVTDENASELDCDSESDGEQTIGFTLAPGESFTCTASHMATLLDLEAGSYFNEACATSGATSDCGDVTTPAKAIPSIATTDTLIPKDHIVLSGLTVDATGTLWVELRVNQECGAAGAAAYATSFVVDGGPEFVRDVTSTYAVAGDQTIRWCTKYSGDDNNAASDWADNGEIIEIDFLDSPLVGAAIGFAIPMLAWALWSRRRREDEKKAA